MNPPSTEEIHETLDQVGGDVPPGDGIVENEYITRSDQSRIVVVKDEAQIESGVYPPTADSEEQLGESAPGLNVDGMILVVNGCIARDDSEAIDTSNIINSRTRGAAKKPGTYVEPGDEEV